MSSGKSANQSKDYIKDTMAFLNSVQAATNNLKGRTEALCEMLDKIKEVQTELANKANDPKIPEMRREEAAKCLVKCKKDLEELQASVIAATKEAPPPAAAAGSASGKRMKRQKFV